MAQTPAGARKTAAKYAGCSLEEFERRIAAGENLCQRCRCWLPSRDFCSDRTRWNGLARRCRGCNARPANPNSPGVLDRRRRLAEGQRWCRWCRKWLPASDVRQGACKPCHAREARRRYAEDEAYRAERRQHARSRKRGIGPIPTEGQEAILETFDGRCAYCNAAATTFDHIIPVSHGGRTVPWNLIPACASCNSSKRCKTIDEFLQLRPQADIGAIVDRIVLEHCHMAR